MTVKDLFRELIELRKAIERTYGLSPEPETLLKILKLRELLKKDVSVRRALKDVGLGWKNFYKYAPIIYMDLELFIPLPKEFIRDYSILGIDLDQLRLALNEVAKYVALDVARKQLLKGKRRRSRFGRKWLELAQNLLKVWIHEISTRFIEQTYL